MCSRVRPGRSSFSLRTPPGSLFTASQRGCGVQRDKFADSLWKAGPAPPSGPGGPAQKQVGQEFPRTPDRGASWERGLAPRSYSTRSRQERAVKTCPVWGAMASWAYNPLSFQGRGGGRTARKLRGPRTRHRLRPPQAARARPPPECPSPARGSLPSALGGSEVPGAPRPTLATLSFPGQQVARPAAQAPGRRPRPALTRPRRRAGARPGPLGEVGRFKPPAAAPPAARTTAPPPEGGPCAARRHPLPPPRLPSAPAPANLACRAFGTRGGLRGTPGGGGVARARARRSGRPPTARPVEGAGSSGSEWLRQWAVPESPPFGQLQVGGWRRGQLRERGGGAALQGPWRSREARSPRSW